MRKAIFELPNEAMTEFAEELSSRDLNNRITGTNSDGEIIIEVEYEKDEESEIAELEELLEEIIQDLENEEEE